MLGTTFGGNHLACAAALAVLEVMEKEELIKKARENGAYLISELKKTAVFENIRGLGLMIGFDLPENLNTLKNTLLLKYKIFTGEAKPHVIRLLPALSIEKSEIDIFLSALKECIRDAAKIKGEQMVNESPAGL